MNDILYNKAFFEKSLNFFICKRLIKGKVKKYSGRNNKGKITIRHKGGRSDRFFRIVNFKYYFWNIYGIILKFVYDPNRKSPLMLVCYLNGILSYHLAVKGNNIGDFVFVGDINLESKKSKVKTLTSFFFNFANGMLINNISLGSSSFSNCKFVKAAGTVAYLLKVDELSRKALVRLPSKEERFFSFTGLCTLGQVANLNHFLLDISKAGRSRHLGIRPTVRGVAMNPIDHPHGGGQGRTSGAGGFRSQVTFKSKVAKTQPTRKKNKIDVFIIKKRKK